MPRRARVRDDREVEVGRQQLDHGLGRRAGVEEHRPAARELVEDAGGDAALDVGEAARAGGQRGLELEALDGDRATVHPADGPARSRAVRSRRTVSAATPSESASGGDLDPAGAACLRHDPLLPLRCVHRDSFVLRVCLLDFAARRLRRAQ